MSVSWKFEGEEYVTICKVLSAVHMRIKVKVSIPYGTRERAVSETVQCCFKDMAGRAFGVIVTCCGLQ